MDCGRRGQINTRAGGRLRRPGRVPAAGGGEGEERSSRGAPRRWSPAPGAATPGPALRRWRRCCRRAGAGSAWVAPPPSSSAPCKGGRSSATRCGPWRGNEAGAARLPLRALRAFPPAPRPLQTRPPGLAGPRRALSPQKAAGSRPPPSPTALGAPRRGRPSEGLVPRCGGISFPPRPVNVRSVTGRPGARRPGADRGRCRLRLGRLGWGEVPGGSWALSPRPSLALSPPPPAAFLFPQRRRRLEAVSLSVTAGDLFEALGLEARGFCSCSGWFGELHARHSPWRQS